MLQVLNKWMSTWIAYRRQKLFERGAAGTILLFNHV